MCINEILGLSTLKRAGRQTEAYVGPPFSFFWFDFYKKCTRCSEPVKIDINSLVTCTAIFFLFLVVLNIIYSFSNSSIPESQTAITSESGYLFEFLIDAIVVLVGIWGSFEIPAKYFSKRLFSKRNETWVG